LSRYIKKKVRENRGLFSLYSFNYISEDSTYYKEENENISPIIAIVYIAGAYPV
jgi:hypothetical protein